MAGHGLNSYLLIAEEAKLIYSNLFREVLAQDQEGYLQPCPSSSYMTMTRHQSADGNPDIRKCPNASAAVSADCLRVHGYLSEDDTQDLIDEYQQSINEQATLITEDSVFFESSSPVSFEFSDSKVGSSAEKIVRYTKLCSHHVNSEKTIQEKNNF